MKKKTAKTPSEDFEINLNRALRYLSYRARSEKEIVTYLNKRIKIQDLKIKNGMIEKIRNRLRELRLIDDEGFARMWAENRKTKAWRVVKMELRQKGISEDTIQNLEFRGQNDDNQPELKILNDEEKAKKLAEKRMERYKELPKNEIYQKMGRYLALKGFDWDTIKRVIDGIFSK